MMLKWTTMSKQVSNLDKIDNFKPTSKRHSSTNSISITMNVDKKSVRRSKRRRSTASTRQSSNSLKCYSKRRRHIIRRDITCKENKYTSTPIKSTDISSILLRKDDICKSSIDIFRDVSNLTPTETVSKRFIPRNKQKTEGKSIMDQSRKKKQLCIDPKHHHAATMKSSYNNSLQIMDLFSEEYTVENSDLQCENNNLYLEKKPIQSIPTSDNYARTLPIFAMDYSSNQLISSNPAVIPPISKITYMPSKKRLRVDHVNDFLQQISYFPTTENNDLFSINNQYLLDNVIIEPDMEITCNIHNNIYNDSSLINNLSLDKIVDAILETSFNDSKAKHTTYNIVSKTCQHYECQSVKSVDDLIRTHEESIVITDHEKCSIGALCWCDLTTPDSGFRSTMIDNPNIESQNVYKLPYENSSLEFSETIINVNEIFHERCIDSPVKYRKRLPSTPKYTNNKHNADTKIKITPTEIILKRQRCVRRKKNAETLEPNVNEWLMTSKLCNTKSVCLDEIHSFCDIEDTYLNDSSFNSTFSGKICDVINTSEELLSYSDGFTCDYETSFDSRIHTLNSVDKKSRRCLEFESAINDLKYVSECSDISCSTKHDKLCKYGHVDIDIKYEEDVLILHVYQCYNLQRNHGVPVNAYIKVGIQDSTSVLGNTNLQRTAVQAESCNPRFDHTFRIPFSKINVEKWQWTRLFMEVWHRDRLNSRSYFLGCMSFPLTITNKNKIQGSYRLLPHSVGQCENVSITSSLVKTSGLGVTNILLSEEDFSKKAFVNPTTLLDEQLNLERHQLFPYTSETETLILQSTNSNMSESYSSIEEIVSLEQIDNELKFKGSAKTNLTQQQKDADENLFLRYLELDPTEGPDALPAATQRKASGIKSAGRTPFTSTHELIRPQKSGFGFSVVWTNPPRIERVEKGLSADRTGILPGDYIIFVENHNVVMMPEIDILNLIRSFGNQLTLETYRKSANTRNGSIPSTIATMAAAGGSTLSVMSGIGPVLPAAQSRLLAHIGGVGGGTGSSITTTTATQRRPSTVCSTTTNTATSAAGGEYNRRRHLQVLQLPQVTFSAEKYISNDDDDRRKAIFQLISKEQKYVTELQFAMSRFVSALQERKDLITAAEHRTLFQNSEEILRLTEDIVEQLVHEDGDYQLQNLARIYHSKLSELNVSYKRYCSGLKKADCVLANKTKNSNSEFVEFLQKPAIPRRRPDITVFIHKPLEHFRDVLKIFNVILSNTKSNYEDYPLISQIVHDLQITYREITTEGGLMEPTGEGRPLLSVQDLENRLVFTKCKPFVLSKPGRHWIFGGDLSRVEGRNVRQYWTLLFSDLLLFAKVSRDRVLFILEDPLPLTHISELRFNVRKKATEFRIIVEPNGRSLANSPTVHCGPDLSRTPKKNPTKRCIILRAHSLEEKAVWQNLLQRQIFHVNATMDGSSFSSPIDSPDAPITCSVGTLQSAESLSIPRQVRLSSGQSNEPLAIPSCPQATLALSYLLQNTSLSKTPDTPSANLSSSTPSSQSSTNSQAFTSHFNSESNLFQPIPYQQNFHQNIVSCNTLQTTPSAELTPSTDVCTTMTHYSDSKLDEEPWDLTNFEYEFTLNIDDYFKYY